MTRRRRIWAVLDPTTGLIQQRGPQRTRPREHARAVVVDSWPESDPPPYGGSAEEWDVYRKRYGYAGGSS